MGKAFLVLDILPLAMAGLVCTLAVVIWIVLVTCLHYKRRKCPKKTICSNTKLLEMRSDTRYVKEMDKNNQCCQPDECQQEKDRWHKTEIYMHRFVRYVFSILKEGDHETQTLVQDNVVPQFFIQQLLLFTFVVLALSVQVCISSYLFIKSYGCSTEPYVHCFEAKYSFLLVGNDELDCRNDTAIDNIKSIICYDLALNVTRAILDAGTIIASGAFYFVLVTWTLLTLANMECWRDKRHTRYLVMASLQLSTMLLALCIVHARVVALVMDNDIVFEDIVYLFIKTYVVVIGGVVPWWKFKPRSTPNTKFTDNA